MIGRGWLSEWDLDNELHVVPVNDLIDHEAIDCLCGPSVALNPHGVWVNIHMSLDGREAVEQARAKELP